MVNSWPWSAGKGWGDFDACKDLVTKTILQGIVNGKRRRGSVKKRWKGNMRVRTGTLPAQLGQIKEDKLERGCCEVICGAPVT